jgi:carboxypeptidase family protein/TonB-dependent receptor-like protein
MPYLNDVRPSCILRLLALLVLSMLVTGRLYAQVAGATLSGTVTDASGAVIPTAHVSITNLATGLTRSVSTDSAGFYSAPNLLPGNYEVTTTAPGFATRVQTGITLTVGEEQVLNYMLPLRQVTEKVQVTGEAPSVQLATSSIGAVVNSTTVRELPINGRSWSDLATLQPGVSAILTQPDISSSQHSRGNRGFASELTVSGARPVQNNYRLDGVSLNDYANGSGSVLGGNLGVDAIEEFSVLTSNYSAEYGRTSGGVVNAITRSGTNQFHGGVYEFLRNSVLDAANFFDISKPPFRRNQFGALAGGPIQKDKTFFFADYEGVRQSQGITQVNTVPSPAARLGNLSTGPVVVDPAAQKYLGFFPLPNGPILAPGDTGIFSFAAQQIAIENFGTLRVDHKFSEKDALFGTYMYDDTTFTSPDNFNDVVIGSRTKRQLLVLEENHIFGPTLVNSVRFGINQDHVDNGQTVSAINPLAADLSLGALPGRAAAAVNVGPLSGFAGALNGAGSAFFRYTSFQGYDDAFLTRGPHSLKFGVSVERIHSNLNNPSDNGTFDFGTLSDFLTNRPQRFRAELASFDFRRHIRSTVIGVYVQDDWRVRHNLTLNLGLRYEISTVPKDTNNMLSHLVNLTDAQPFLGNPYFLNPTLHNFEPRVGFAWDPFGDGKTAIRGGFGIFDVLPLPYEFLLLMGDGGPFTVAASATQLPPGSFYTGATGLLNPTAVRQIYLDHKPHRNYVMQRNLIIQREIVPKLTALIGYVGSNGVHQPFRADDINIVLPKLTSAGYLWPSPIGSGTVLNPNAGDMRGLMWAGNSSYNALEVGVNKAMSHGLQVQGSFTWSKSIDNNSSTTVGDPFSNSISSLQWFDLRLSRGLSDFNVGRILVIDGTWQVPEFKGITGPASWALNGWQLGAIFKAQDGLPFTATFGTDGDPLGLNSTDPYDFPNRLSGPGCGSLVNPGNPNNYIRTQCFAVPTAPTPAFYAANCDPNQGTAPQCFNLRGNAGRNILIGPGLVNMDFSVFKNNYVRRISENFNVQFRAELFNVFNRPNFSVSTNNNIFDSTGAQISSAGLLTSTATTARELQLAVKIIW